MGTVRMAMDDAIATIIIDNPPLNLLTNDVRDTLLAWLDGAVADDGVRAIVLAGAGGRAFSAGSDVREFLADMREDRGAERAERERHFLERIAGCPKPIVAAIEGHALGGGCELALACDFRIAGEGATLGFPEIRLGVFPLNTVEWCRLLVGAAWTRELMLLGQPIGAEDARRIGLVHRVVATGQARSAAGARARELAALPGLTLAEIKRLLNRRVLALLAEGAGTAQEAAARVFRSEDLREGVAAFREKRPPRFRHR
jgi:enoyl-CoA hydratase/carnithine racemase